VFCTFCEKQAEQEGSHTGKYQLLLTSVTSIQGSRGAMGCNINRQPHGSYDHKALTAKGYAVLKNVFQLLLITGWS